MVGFHTFAFIAAQALLPEVDCFSLGARNDGQQPLDLSGGLLPQAPGLRGTEVETLSASASYLERNAVSQHRALSQAYAAIKPRLEDLRSQEFSNPAPPFRQELENEGDAQYTGKVAVGSQTLAAVVDTGSFDLVVFSSQCRLCGDAGKLYNDTLSTSYSPGSISAEQNYGSGTTKSFEAYETVKVGPFTASNQVFWKVLDAQMPILNDATFQAILGVGPPSSALKMALDEAAQARAEVLERQKAGENVTSYWPIVKHFDEVAEHAKKSLLFTTNIAAHTLSICLRRGERAPGVFTWNDVLPQEMPTAFTQVAVVGDTYWSAELRDVKLGPVPRFNREDTPLGCSKVTCSAVIDTGTSLIVAPNDAVTRVNNLLQDWSASGVNCTDLSALPELEFKMDGKLFTLPPESYVGELTGRMNDDMKQLLPHVQNENGPSCVALLMTLDAPSQFGPLWVLGLPFFRKYYTAFRLKHNEVDPKTMAFAPAGPDCYPMSSEASMLRQQQIGASPLERRVPMKIHASKLRVPRWLGRTAHLARLGHGIRL